MLHSDEFNIAERSGPVIGSATATSLTIDNPTIAPLVAGEISASLEGLLATDKLTLSKGTLRSDAIDGNFAGDVSLADGSIALQLNADVVSAALPAAGAARAWRKGCALHQRGARFVRQRLGELALGEVGRTDGRRFGAVA